VESTEEKIAALEVHAAANPDDADAREDLIHLYFEAGLADSRRRFEHVLRLVIVRPTSSLARCPLAHFDRDADPEIYGAVERAWRDHVASNPDDLCMTTGLAGFIAGNDRPRAIALLRDFAREHPSETEAWIDLGRTAVDPVEQLSAFLEARRRGSEHPNLLAWIARSAIHADDFESLRLRGTELLALAEASRQSHGDQLDWPEEGRALFARARSVTTSDDRARELVRAISDHAYHKHWGHTAIGIAALGAGAIEDAAAHLAESASVRADYRLRSYGPSFLLADALCKQGQWMAVADFLVRWQAFWEPDTLQELLEEVANHRRPEFPGT